jgi:hypothetical protein
MLWSVPVVHGAEGDHVGVFELAEAELGLGLGAVAGDYLGDWPVLAVGDQDTFAEDLGFQVGAGLVVDVEGEPVLGWCVSGQGDADDAPTPRCDSQTPAVAVPRPPASHLPPNRDHEQDQHHETDHSETEAAR